MQINTVVIQAKIQKNRVVQMCLLNRKTCVCRSLAASSILAELKSVNDG